MKVFIILKFVMLFQNENKCEVQEIPTGQKLCAFFYQL